MFMRFPDTPAAETRRHSIGSLSERFGISLRTIRFYEEKRLLRPTRATPRRRVYGDADVARLALIVAGRRIGLAVETLAELLAVCDDHGEAAFRTALAAALDAREAELEAEIAERKDQRRRLGEWRDELAEA